MMDLGKRVKDLRKDQGWTQLDLSKRTSLSRGRIAQIETNPVAEVKGESLVSLAKAFGYSTEQLLSEDELGLLAGLKLQPITKKAPVISWDSLESIMNGTFMLNDNNQWVGCPHDISDSSFALEVQNDVMTSNNGRTYPRGTLIFIDQTRKPKTGDRVVAIDRDTLESVFREYVVDGGIRYLKPLNTVYPIQKCTDNTHIIGVIVGSYLAE
jgi:transcriptional regulator with XRE-family HTH domain|tara:strand:- start:1191 stop:1823 length:633 start_codon:yes stop_codon:yes gene_type:complete